MVTVIQGACPRLEEGSDTETTPCRGAFLHSTPTCSLRGGMRMLDCTLHAQTFKNAINDATVLRRAHLRLMRAPLVLVQVTDSPISQLTWKAAVQLYL